MAIRASKNSGDIVLRPVHPNAGVEADYRRRLTKLINEMNDSFTYWLRAAYRKNEPVIAQDALPADALQKEIEVLTRRWRGRFDEAAPALAEYFGKTASRRSAAALRAILKKAGISIEFKMTRAQRDILNATIEQNVQLIKSIPEQYLTQVQGSVMRSVQAGRDLGSLAKELQQHHGVTKRRAALIARSQNNLATAAMTRARQSEIGIEEAVWLHSAGGREPRPTHVANNGKRYSVKDGWYDPHAKKNIWPGELINCFPASTRIDFASNVEKAFRHFHSGELSQIVTHSGKTLRATFNHPILTPHGWRPIGTLNEGDYVIEIADDAFDAIKNENNIDDAIPMIAEIFCALSESWRLEVAVGTEFHGDAIADSDIDVVFAARPLSFGARSFDRQSFQKFGLSAPDPATFGLRALLEFTGRSLFAANGFVGSAREALSFISRRRGHAHMHGLATGPNGAADLFDPYLDSFSLMAKLARQRKQAAAPFMQRAQTTRIIKVERCGFSGHVFNLQTRSGYYAAEGIISHNCRCVSRPVIKGFS